MQLNIPISTFLLLLPSVFTLANAQAAATVPAAAAPVPAAPAPAAPAVPAAAPAAPAPAAAAPANAGVAAGGGAATSLAPTQYPTATTAGSLFTANGVTSASWALFIQTFATTALGSALGELGPSPKAGSIGLGNIQGPIGVAKTKRGIDAVETPAPLV